MQRLFPRPATRLTAAGTALMALTLLAARNARADVSSGLTAYWDFDDNLTDKAVNFPFAASTVADDAVFVNEPDASYGTGLFGKAYQGIGGASAGHAMVMSSDDISGVISGSVSVCFWFQAKGPTSTWQAAVALGEGSAWRVARAGDQNPLRIGYAGGSPDIYSTTTFGSPITPVAVWHHVAAVSQGGVSAKLYIDGVLEATGTAPTLALGSTGEMWIGGNPQAGGRAWNGLLDDIGIWNRPLSAADVLNIYTQGKNNAKSLGALLTEESLDADRDGLPDTWEIANLPAGAHLDNGSVNPNFGPAGDPDADSSSNQQEYARKTNPRKDDTDEDGLKDGLETNTLVWKSATDTGTDPLKADTDGDGLKDGVETNTRTFISAASTGTDPHDIDSDDDTFADGIEVTYGSNPNLDTSTPTASGLPITDNFEDGILDNARWSTDLNVAVAGAAVAEEGGHITLTGRGHFFTKEQFDPTTLGGIYLTGKWTFRSTDDFVQILTRTDAVPAGQYGETQEGIEFYASQTDNSFNISVRGGSFGVDSQKRSGGLVLTNGKTYDFTIIDNGANYLSMRLSESGNSANSAMINANLSNSAATANHIAFHNREGTRTSHLEEVVISVLTDTDHDGMPDFWEKLYDLSTTANDAATDTDTDGVSNLDEYLRGLNPKKDDTDGDGLKDGIETNTLSWTSAANTGTDPLKADTDGDLLKDGVENNTNSFVNANSTGTDPFRPDTDGDGMADGPEVAVGRNPVDPSDGRTGLDVGLSAYWNFDGTLDDIAQSAHLGEGTVADNGTFTGAPDAAYSEGPGRFGSSLALTGGNGWVTVPKSLDTIGNTLTRSVSISVWLKANAFDSDWQGAISHGEGSHWRIARQSNTFPGNMAYAGGSGDIYSTTTFEPPTEWYHVVAVTTEGTGTALFINGVQEATGGEPNLDVDLAASPDLYIGANPQSGGREWNGEIDDAAIWTRPLTEEEITKIYQAGTGASSLGVLLGMAPPLVFHITAYSYNPATKQVSLAWESKAGTNYAVNYSTDLRDWTGTVTDSTPGAAGAATTTTYTFAVPAAVSGAPKLFFRVKSK
ncbi:MAG: LamG-like jellyroll fold domain-containing protein [Verrucomicrobiota bacterium]